MYGHLSRNILTDNSGAIPNEIYRIDTFNSYAIKVSRELPASGGSSVVVNLSGTASRPVASTIRSINGE